jgi:hypothetical protein
MANNRMASNRPEVFWPCQPNSSLGMMKEKKHIFHQRLPRIQGLTYRTTTNKTASTSLERSHGIKFDWEDYSASSISSKIITLKPPERLRLMRSLPM